MKERKVSRKVISIILSVLMVFGTMPMMAFVSTAAVTATDPVRSEGDWLQPPDPVNSVDYYDYWDSQFSGFDGNGGGADYATVGLHGTLAAHDANLHDEAGRRMTCYFYFMQTTDNQVMTYQVHVIGKKNNGGSTNSSRLTSINTNYSGSAYEGDADFADALNRYAAFYPNPTQADEYPEYWTGGESNCTGFNSGPTFPYNSSLVDMNNTKTCHFYYTARFVADGSATYTPQWEINYSTGAGLFGIYSYTDYTTSSLTDTLTDKVKINYNPRFVIEVVDLREVNTLIDIADDMNVDVTSIVGNRNFDGSVYYSQQEVDGVVAQLRALLLCDYSGLDAQIARGDAIETENYNGALGGKLYDQTKYDAFLAAYAAAKAVDRFYLDDDDNHTNQGIINAAATALQTAIDELMATRKYLVTYYVDGAVYARNTVDSSGPAYNFHDVTDHFITPPEMTGYRFIGWMDENGNLIRENTVITGDMTAYAKYYVSLKGTLPYDSNGIWYHLASQKEGVTDDRGENWVTMNVKDTDFYFVQTKEIESFSFYTDLTAYKNGGSNYGSITNVGFINDAESNAFSALIENDGTSVSCLTGNAGPAPSSNDLNNDGVADGDLPGIPFADYLTQKTTYYVTWRYIYTFTADGAAEYNPKWNINYSSGSIEGLSSSYDLTYSSGDAHDTYVGFNIYVTDVREINNLLDKAESICNNNSGAVSQQDREALRGKVDSINNAYTLDGSVYYPQSEIDALVAELLAYIPSGDIPCDYTEFYEVFNRASQIDRDHGNDNNHYVDEVWDNFLACYQAAVDLDKNMMIDDANEHQQLIGTVTENLYFALEQFNYQTHVNQKANDTALINLVNSAIPTYGDDITDNANGKYDTTAYQNYLTALEQAQAVIAADYYLDPTGVNDNQAIIDSAYNALYAAIQAFNDPANQNDPCDYTALEEAISAASAITDNELFTPATYQALQDALADAQAVPSGLYNDDSGNNQQMIDDATDALVAAINNLLADAIANAENVSTDGMDATTVADLNDAIDAAEDVATDTTASAQDKADAINGITTAVDNLEADKTELELALYSAGLIDTTDVPQSLVDALDAAVSNGQLVDGDPDASVSSVEYATEQITNAIADILQQVINDASNADTDGMTTNSIQDLADAIDNAQAIHDDTDSNAYTLAETIADVQAALADLEPDKSELEELINLASAIDTSNVSPSLVQDLNYAIGVGETILADTGASVVEVADAVQGLKDAIDAILQNIVDEANNIDTTGMTPISAANFETALDDAENVLNNGGTYQEKADAINALVDAINDLNADKTELEYAIDAGEAIDTTDIPQNLVDALENALTDGNIVDADTNATVQEVSDATDAITDAIADILAEVISQAENTDTTGMTDQSIQDLQDVIDAAEDLLDPNRDPAATAEELADAIKDIQDAVNDLTPDKTELQETVDAAETIDPSNLDPAVASDLQDAIDNGNNVLNDPDATVQEIQDAINQINDVIDQILQDAINDAQDVVDNPNGLDPDTISDLQDAIDAAENILNDPDSTADDKVNALDDLQAALDSVTVDKSALAAAIALAENTDTLGYEVTGVQALLDAVDDGRDVYDDDAATVAEVAAATQAILDAIDGLTVDKFDLEQKLLQAQAAANDPTYEHDIAMDALIQAISDGNDVYNDDAATVQDVWDAIQALDDAIMNLNLVPPIENIIISVFDDDGNSICDISVDVSYGNNILFSDIESQLPTDLSAYIGADEVFLGWTDANGDFYDYGAYGIIDRANPQVHLTTQLTKITAGTGTDVTVDRYNANSTDYTYMVGLDPTGVTVDDLKAELQNRSTEIIIERDGYEILSTELVGTGCLVKCVNALDHSIVYEVATVILYGDVNGDGLVDTEDRAILYNDAFYGEGVLTSGTVYYIAGDLAKDGAIDAFDYFYVEGIRTGGREFDQTSELYK